MRRVLCRETNLYRAPTTSPYPRELLMVTKANHVPLIRLNTEFVVCDGYNNRH